MIGPLESMWQRDPEGRDKYDGSVQGLRDIAFRSVAKSADPWSQTWQVIT